MTLTAANLTFFTTSPGRVLVTTSDWTATVVTRHYSNNQRTKTRVYGAIDTFAADENALVDVNALKPVSLTGHDDFESQAARDAHMKEYRRLARATTARARETLSAALPTVLRSLDQESVDVERFSKNAGCTMCSCSPGFVLDRRLTLNGKAVDVWFDAPTAK